MALYALMTLSTDAELGGEHVVGRGEGPGRSRYFFGCCTFLSHAVMREGSSAMSACTARSLHIL